MALTYKPCEYSPAKEHDFTGIDDRCMWCDAKPWYVSIQADHPAGEPVAPGVSFASMWAYAAATATAPVIEDKVTCDRSDHDHMTLEEARYCMSLAAGGALDWGTGYTPEEADAAAREMLLWTR